MLSAMTNILAGKLAFAAGREAKRRWAWIAAALLLAALIVAGFLLPLGDWLVGLHAWLTALRHWLVRLGPAGMAIFALGFVLTTVILAPDWPLSAAAGLIYGGWALPMVLVAATTAASLSFLLARYLLRDRVRRFIAARPRLSAVDRAVADEGWIVVLLLRLSPVFPFNLQNYVFGVTGVPFRHYVAATFVGIIPFSALYVYAGALGKAAEEGADVGGVLHWAMLAVGLLATVLAAVLVARKAKAKLEEAKLDDA